jgi:hypothetical protein|tara:strand:+ start:254 stop:508 length:255 start_codon:yes stop_codon:yes gene_type:complete
MGLIDTIILGFAGLSLAVTLQANHPSPISAKDISEMERSARALELYLQDQKDYEEHCPDVEWYQPALSIYKSTLQSHLPEGCKE